MSRLPGPGTLLLVGGQQAQRLLLVVDGGHGGRLVLLGVAELVKVFVVVAVVGETINYLSRTEEIIFLPASQLQLLRRDDQRIGPMHFLRLCLKFFFSLEKSKKVSFLLSTNLRGKKPPSHLYN